MPEHDVAEMQIAVATPHSPHGPAAIEQTAQPFQPAQRLALQRCGRLGRKQRGPCREVGIVLLDQALDGFCAAERLSQNRCFAMIDEDRITQVIEQSARQTFPLTDTIQSLGLVKAPHDQKPLDHRPLGIEGKTTVRLPPQGRDFEVNLRRIGAIERQLRAYRPLALRQRGEVEKTEAHLSLHLVSTVADKKDHRRVGVDPNDPVDAFGIVIRVGQEGDRLVLCRRLHRLPTRHAASRRASVTPRRVLEPLR